MKNTCTKLLLIVSLAIVACGEHIETNGLPLIVIETEAGDIYATLEIEKAPQSAGAFISNIKKGIYDSSHFYRVLSDENQPTGVEQSNLIQGGIWQKPELMKNRTPIVHEHTGITGLTHEDGTLSFARQDTGTASTEFFICIGAQPGFDLGGRNNKDGMGYAAFGRVVKGMKVARSIYSRPQEGQYFKPLISIKKIRIIKE